MFGMDRRRCTTIRDLGGELHSNWKRVAGWLCIGQVDWRFRVTLGPVSLDLRLKCGIHTISLLLSYSIMACREKSGYWCPQCNKCFNVENTVIKHMGQPWSDCATSWMHNLEDISSNLSDHNVLIPSQLVPNLYAQDAPMDDAPIADQEEPDCLDNGSNVQSDTRSWHTDMNPGAAHTYGPGTTFMDKFDCDEHANRRTHNIYYPFSSRSDWQLGAWLLHSHLSIESINQFLHLDLVSTCIWLLSAVYY